MSRPLFLLTLLLLLTSCRTADTRPDEPAGDIEEAVISAALRHAFVGARDVPDYSLLSDPNRVILTSERALMQPGKVLQSEGDPLPDLTPGALPDTRDVRFVLLSGNEIRERAESEGAFAHAQVGAVEIDGERATAEIATTWAIPPDSETIYLSGGGYVLELRREDGSWTVSSILSRWIS